MRKAARPFPWPATWSAIGQHDYAYGVKAIGGYVTVTIGGDVYARSVNDRAMGVYVDGDSTITIFGNATAISTSTATPWR